MMTETSQPSITDDSPKTNPWREDYLGFKTFSSRLAEALVAQQAPNGYVFGLHGEWGSGKSTIVNFAKSFLEKWREESREDIANLQWFDFEPWIVSGHQDLAAAFFKILSEKLGDGADKRATAKQFAKGALDASADKLIDAAATIGWVIDHTGGAASKAGTTVGKAAIRKATEKWLSEPSLQKTYGQLVERLKKSSRRFIVFVDDIDRLTSSEIRSLMQMVKTVGRLPNVTYCLSYDRQIVWTALEELAPGDEMRSGYAEKIVQHEREVPVPSRMRILKMLENALPPLPAAPTVGLRWRELLQAGLQRWVRHPRDVVRLSNAMHFAWAALKDEVDAHDLLCMEALRLFDRKVFDWIRDNRDILLVEGLRYMPAKDNENEAEAEALGQMLSEGARADIIPVLRILFPNNVKIFGGRRGFSTEQWSQVVARRGIASRAGYDAYFSLSPSPGAVPKRLVDEAAAAGTTRVRHIELIDLALGLKDEFGATLVGEYLQEIIHRVSTLGEVDLIPLLKALIDRSMAVYVANGEASFLGPSSAHHVLVSQLLERLGQDLAGEALDGIFAASDDLGALTALYVDLGRSLGVINSNGGPVRLYIKPERLDPLGAILLSRIEAAAAADTLCRFPNFYEIAVAWHHLDSSEPVQAWMGREARRDGHALAKVSNGLVGPSNDGTKLNYGLFRSTEMDLFDVEAIAEGCERFASATDLTDVERARILGLAANIETLRRRDAQWKENAEAQKASS